MKIIIGFEWNYQKRHWLQTAAEQAGYSVEILDTPELNAAMLQKKWYRPFEIWSVMKLARRAVRLAQPGDIYVGASFLSVVWAAVLDHRRKITILGMI